MFKERVKKPQTTLSLYPDVKSLYVPGLFSQFMTADMSLKLTCFSGLSKMQRFAPLYHPTNTSFFNTIYAQALKQMLRRKRDVRSVDIYCAGTGCSGTESFNAKPSGRLIKRDGGIQVYFDDVSKNMSVYCHGPAYGNPFDRIHGYPKLVTGGNKYLDYMSNFMYNIACKGYAFTTGRGPGGMQANSQSVINFLKSEVNISPSTQVNAYGYSRGGISIIDIANYAAKHGTVVLQMRDPVSGPGNSQDYSIDPGIKTIMVTSRDNVFPFFFQPRIRANNMTYIIAQGEHGTTAGRKFNRLNASILLNLKPGVYIEEQYGRLTPASDGDVAKFWPYSSEAPRHMDPFYNQYTELDPTSLGIGDIRRSTTDVMIANRFK